MNPVMRDKLVQARHFLTTRLTRERGVFASDILIAFSSLYMTVRLLSGPDTQTLQMAFLLKHCFVFALVSFGLFFWLRDRLGAVTYTSLEKLSYIVGGAVLANLFYHPLMILMGSLPPLTPVINTFLFMGGLVASRFLLAFWKKETIITKTRELSPKIPAVVVGYNEQIGTCLRQLQSKKGDAFPYQLEGILLETPLTEDDLPPPFPILGMVHDFIPVIQKLASKGREPGRLLITQEALNDTNLRQVLLKFQGRGILNLCFETVPGDPEVTLRPLCLEDLLGKACLNSSETPAREPGWQEIQGIIDSTCVLITGVHDPVIRSLAVHIVRFYPRHLVIVDASEQALAALKTKFDQLYPDVSCEYVLASITDQTIMDGIIKTRHPQIIIQGDRVTHPDLMEENLLTTVQKNILGPLRVAKEIQETGESLFILVNPQTPTRLSQLITRLVSHQLQQLDQQATPENPARFLVINSADVWGNLDSITAFWPESLVEGLKITLPSPDAYSYLLSADEAARTILQATVKALTTEETKGQVLQLSGGQPSRFLELIRSLSLLKGLIPEVDVKIQFSGNPVPTVSCGATDVFDPLTSGVMVGTPTPPSSPDDNLFQQLTDLLEKGQTAKMVALLEKAVMNKEDTLPLKAAG